MKKRVVALIAAAVVAIAGTQFASPASANQIARTAGWINWTVEGGPYGEEGALAESLGAFRIPRDGGIPDSYVYIPALRWKAAKVAHNVVWTYDDISDGWMGDSTPRCVEALEARLPGATTNPELYYGKVFDCFDTYTPSYEQLFGIPKAEGAGKGAVMVDDRACRMFTTTADNWCGMVLDGRVYKFDSGPAPAKYRCPAVIGDPSKKGEHPWGLTTHKDSICIPTPSRPGTYDYPIVGYSEGRGSYISCTTYGSTTNCRLGYEGAELPTGKLRIVVTKNKVSLHCFDEEHHRANCNW